MTTKEMLQDHKDLTGCSKQHRFLSSIADCEFEHDRRSPRETAHQEDTMTTTTTYASMIRGEPYTDCEHRHRRTETAFACKRRRNPTEAPGTIVVDVVARVGDRYRPLTEAEEDSIVYRYYR